MKPGSSNLLGFTQKWSLSARLNVLFLVLLAIPLLLVVFWSDFQARNTISSQQEKGITRSSQDLAEKMDFLLSQKLNVAKTWASQELTVRLVSSNSVLSNSASVPNAEAGPNSVPAPGQNSTSAQGQNSSILLKSSLSFLLNNDPTFQSFYIIDTSGKILLAGEDNITGQFKEVEPYFGQLHLQLISEVGISQISGKPAMYFSWPILAVTPDNKPGDILGFITFRVDPQFLWDRIKSETDSYGSGSFASLVDANGIYIADGRETDKSLKDADFRYLFHSVRPLPNNQMSTILTSQRFGKLTKLPSLQLDELMKALTSAQSTSIFTYANSETKEDNTVGTAQLKLKQWFVVQEVPRHIFLDPVRLMTITSLLGLLIIALLTAALIIFVIRKTVKPFLQLQAPIARLSQGDLSNCQVAVNASWEIERVARAFEGMAFNLHELVAQVRQSATVVNSVAAEVQDSTQKQVWMAKEQSGEIQKAITAMEELVQAAKQITLMAHQVSEAAGQTMEISNWISTLTTNALTRTEQNQRELELNMTQIVEMRKQVSSISEYTAGLVNTMRNIGEVVNVIEAVADETHLLSLNASIEAAGAGQYGERFAVVAGEVKQLAHRSQQAAREVNHLLTSIQTATNQVFEAVNSGVEAVDRASSQAATIKATMHQLANGIEEFTSGTPRIVEAAKDNYMAADQISIITEQQLQASYQVLEIMRQVEATLQQGLVSNQQMLVVSMTLGDSSEELQKTVSRFRLN